MEGKYNLFQMGNFFSLLKLLYMPSTPSTELSKGQCSFFFIAFFQTKPKIQVACFCFLPPETCIGQGGLEIARASRPLPFILAPAAGA